MARSGTGENRRRDEGVSKGAHQLFFFNELTFSIFFCRAQSRGLTMKNVCSFGISQG